MTSDDVKSESQFPVIELWEDILVVPIVGNLDSSRAKSLMDTLLRKTRQVSARVVIIDLSGVAVMDTNVSKRIMDLGEAVRLMGSQYMVSGIQPDQTHSLVELGIDLGSVQTYHTLNAALTEGLNDLGLTIEEESQS